MLIFAWLWVELTLLGLAALGALVLFNPDRSQLVVFVTVAICITLALLVLAAVRYRLQRSPRWIASKCPTCGGLLYRSHRRPINRLIGLFIPLHRYYCVNPQCRWHGLRIKPVKKR